MSLLDQKVYSFLSGSIAEAREPHPQFKPDPSHLPQRQQKKPHPHATQIHPIAEIDADLEYAPSLSRPVLKRPPTTPAPKSTPHRESSIVQTPSSVPASKQQPLFTSPEKPQHSVPSGEFSSPYAPLFQKNSLMFLNSTEVGSSPFDYPVHLPRIS